MTHPHFIPHKFSTPTFINRNQFPAYIICAGRPQVYVGKNASRMANDQGAYHRRRVFQKFKEKNQPGAFLLTVSTTTSWRVGFFAALTCNRERRKWVNRCEKLMQQHYLTNLCECMWPLTTVTCLAPELENSHTACPHSMRGIPLERHLMREQRHKSNYSYWLWPNTHKKVSTAQWPCRLKKDYVTNQTAVCLISATSKKKRMRQSNGHTLWRRRSFFESLLGQKNRMANLY